eukprot:s583_g26.t2
MALAAVDWKGWKSAAAEFLRAHPRVEVRDLSRLERVLIPSAREAWQSCTLGAQRCDLCGQWTSCWCEGCDRPATAVCTECDRDHALCCRCVSQGRVFSEVARSSSAEYIEVSGFHDEAGRFVPVGPAVRVPTASLSRQADGSFNIEQLMRFAVMMLGVQTVDDFRYMWSSAQACYGELENMTGRKLSSQEAMRIAVAWTNARRESIKHTAALGQEVAQLRNSSVGVPTHERPLPASAGPPAPTGSKMRKLEDAQKQLKLDQLFQLVLTHILAELGVTVAQLQDPSEMQKFKDAMMGNASRLSVQRLGALTAAFRRWLKFCTAKDISPRAPTSLVLAEFLREVSVGGPTAASSMHASMKWFATSFGAAFPMDHWATKHFRFHAVHHTGRQMPELQPWELVNLVILMKKSQGTHRVLVAQMLVAALGCIRFEHLQRSKFVQSHGPSLEFSWPTQTLRDFYANELPSECSFLLPAIALQPDEFWEVTEHTPLVTNKPMSRARFLELMRGALFLIGVEFSQAQAAGFNRLRRFMPTLANVMELSDLDLQSVGNWCDIPSGRWPGPCPSEGSCLPPNGSPLCCFEGPTVVAGEAAVHQPVPGPLPQEEDRNGDREGSESSLDTSSSASDLTADGEDLVGILADETAAEELSWIRQDKKVHAVREEVDGRATPWCRDKPFAQEPQGRGQGFTTLMQSDFWLIHEAAVLDLRAPPAAACIISRIDVLQDDRGLAACFRGANLESAWIDSYVKAHSLTTLDDFVYMIQASDWEKSAQVAPKSEDLDEVLPDSTIQQLNDWTKRYNLSFDSVLEPSEQLRSRLYREFRKQTMTVVEMKKVRSVLTMAQPRPSDSIALPGGLQLQLEKEVSVSLRIVTDYYYAEKVFFMDLSNALHYCDRALRDTMDYGNGGMLWLQRNDLLTRGKMATYVRRGQPGQWALDNALRDTHLEWRSPAVQPLLEVPEAPRDKRPPVAEAAGDRKRQIKSDSFRTVSQIKGGQKLCKPWNDGRGCHDPKCSSLHCCDVRTADGGACGSKKHTRLEHADS